MPGNPFKRMIAEPGGRRVDVEEADIPSKLERGWRVDTFPDDRAEIALGLRGKYPNKPALVIATGPSTAMAGKKLATFVNRVKPVVWGVNDVWRVMDGKPIGPCDYLVVLDRGYWEQYAEEYRAFLRERPECIACLNFTPWEDLRHFEVPIGTTNTPEKKPPYIVGEFFHGGSGGIIAVQMAMQAGCNPIYLIGHDCRAVGKRTHGFGSRSAEEASAKYVQGQAMLAGYAVLAEHAKQQGVQIINLSEVSAIECFEKRPDLLEGKESSLARSPKPRNQNKDQSTGLNAPDLKGVDQDSEPDLRDEDAPDNRRDQPPKQDEPKQQEQAKETEEAKLPPPAQTLASETSGLSQRAALAQQQSLAGLQMLDELGDDGETAVIGGLDESFVRMLRHDGQVRGVAAEHVPDKLRDGYFFLKSEPCTPRTAGDPDVAPSLKNGAEGAPRIHAEFSSRLQVLQYWLGELRQDRQKFSALRDLNWGIVTWIKRELDKAKNSGNIKL